MIIAEKTSLPMAALLCGNFPQALGFGPSSSVLALYTDGLVESPGTDIDDATTALAQRLTTAHAESLETLSDALLDHAERSAPRNDDIALLLLRPHGRP